ncbi:MAG: radical SAM protein [Lactobacillales bacterium]|jgi:uncharacterized protein|nr:radical SAM protein [Lactobacillales bacterium]
MHKEKQKEFLNKIVKKKRVGRLGKIFKTEDHYYFYDTGTGKVAQFKLNVYLVMKCLLEEGSYESLFSLPMTQKDILAAVDEILLGIEEHDLLSAPEVQTLTGDAVINLSEILESSINSVTLEVTEECNLRCKYCIYHPSHPDYREFGHKHMSWDTAKKAIDFLKAHSLEVEAPYIGFYGGEPLINFKLIQKCIEYAKEVFGEKVTFSLTTNATLVTEKIAKFLFENDTNVIISLDGPKEIHDENRIAASGQGSYEATVNGAKKLLVTAEKFGKKESIIFNVVVFGEDYHQRYDKIQSFFNQEKWLSEDIQVMISNADYGPIESEYFVPSSKEDQDMMKNLYSPLFTWDAKKRQASKKKEQLISDLDMDKAMQKIHKRRLLKKPLTEYGMNGCCVPGERRIYVNAEGVFFHCEKVGNIPSIGNVHSGLDEGKIKRFYVDEYIQEAVKYCKNCWAINLCSLCYIGCYDANGKNFAYRHDWCRHERKYSENALIRYYSTLEKNPETLEKYNNMEVS